MNQELQKEIEKILFTLTELHKCDKNKTKTNTRGKKIQKKNTKKYKIQNTKTNTNFHTTFG